MEVRKLIALGLAALLVGAATPMLASASEEELGTLDEGVYAVNSAEERFTVETGEATNLVVRSDEGDLVGAEHMDAGEQRTFVLDDEHAFVAVDGGEATITAEDEGEVERVTAARENVTLVEANASALDRSLDVQVPEGAMLGSLALDGEAEGLEVTVAADGEQLLAADGDELATPAPLGPETAGAEILDVEVAAEELDGELVASFLTLMGPTEQRADIDEDEPGELNATVEASALSYTPVRFTVPADEEPGRLLVEIDSGYVFDASLYTADGTQVDHVHAGPPLEETRDDCQEADECWRGHDDEEMAPHTIERQLPAGDHVLFVREAHIEGTLTLEDAEGQPLLPDAERGEITGVDVDEDREISLERPLLDVRYDGSHGDGELQPRVSVDVGGEVAFAYEALAQAHQRAAESETTIAPTAMQAGTATVTVEGATEDLRPGGHGVVLILPSG